MDMTGKGQLGSNWCKIYRISDNSSLLNNHDRRIYTLAHFLFFLRWPCCSASPSTYWCSTTASAKKKRRKDGGLTQVEISFLSFSLTTCTCAVSCVLRRRTCIFSLNFLSENFLLHSSWVVDLYFVVLHFVTIYVESCFFEGRY